MRAYSRLRILNGVIYWIPRLQAGHERFLQRLLCSYNNRLPRPDQFGVLTSRLLKRIFEHRMEKLVFVLLSLFFSPHTLRDPLDRKQASLNPFRRCSRFQGLLDDIYVDVFKLLSLKQRFDPCFFLPLSLTQRAREFWV